MPGEAFARLAVEVRLDSRRAGSRPSGIGEGGGSSVPGSTESLVPSSAIEAIVATVRLAGQPIQPGEESISRERVG